MNVLCNYPLGPNQAGYEYLKMVKDEWNSTQLLTRDQLFNVGEMAWIEDIATS